MILNAKPAWNAYRTADEVRTAWSIGLDFITMHDGEEGMIINRELAKQYNCDFVNIRYGRSSAQIVQIKVEP